MTKSLIELASQEMGKIIDIQGGVGVQSRLESMGILPGKIVTKISAQLLRGPVTIMVDRRQLALGFGIASKILVEVNKMK
ncbi:ferrous iron transport protein A [bacterium]|nr:ferrous iron transport protein A [bacterium]